MLALYFVVIHSQAPPKKKVVNTQAAKAAILNDCDTLCEHGNCKFDYC